MPSASANPEQLADQVLAGDRRALARAITLVESSRSEHRMAAEQLLTRLASHAGESRRLGITGAPGVGKSTFINALGVIVIAEKCKVAVLSVDPSSQLTGGSILGDKTRMQELARNNAAFVRPSPAGGTLGGVHRRTREAMLLVEAAGYDVIIVETVGIGQSETEVAGMTDVFLLLMQPGGGDELQGIKRGVIEMADFILVTKADGELHSAAQKTVAGYANALRYLRARSGNWQVPVQTCSALTGEGIAAIWQQVCDYHDALQADGELAARRAEQSRNWLWAELSACLLASLRENTAVNALLPEIERRVEQGELAPTVAARQLLAQLGK
ncbi:MAG: methylmalonyl Co-A mutase-associated GTPase MeaB [Gammaproteobacteria bacterium]|nr:methylmalonyl Co-A mutase-associated GTPase MeaB [Gammaproteobacteria bacterium]